MQTYNYSPTIAVANTLARISAATGIDNLTRSSAIRFIAESNAADISMAISSANSALTQFYTSSATGQFLDAKAFEVGLSRNILDSIIVFNEDQAIRIVPITEGDTFGDHINTDEATIISGTRVSIISNKYGVYLTEDTTLDLSSTYQYVSVKIEPISQTQSENGTFTLNEGQLLDFDTSTTATQQYAGLELEVTKPIVIETVTETDDQLRARILEAKSNLVEGTPNSISLILNEIPDLIGYNIQQNTRNSNSIDFNIVTDSLVAGTGYSFLPAYIKNLANNHFSPNTDIVVNLPLKLDLFITYTTSGSEVIPDETIKETLKNTVNTLFVYSQDNIVNKTALENQVKDTLKQLVAFNITQFQGYDSSIGIYVISSTGDLEVPVSYYTYVSDVTQLANVTV